LLTPRRGGNRSHSPGTSQEQQQHTPSRRSSRLSSLGAHQSLHLAPDGGVIAGHKTGSLLSTSKYRFEEDEFVSKVENSSDADQDYFMRLCLQEKVFLAELVNSKRKIGLIGPKFCCCS
jgi:hypothetical protein